MNQGFLIKYYLILKVSRTTRNIKLVEKSEIQGKCIAQFGEFISKQNKTNRKLINSHKKQCTGRAGAYFGKYFISNKQNNGEKERVIKF